MAEGKFLRLGKGYKINDTLVEKMIVSNKTEKTRYFLKDIYGIRIEIDKKHFDEIVDYLGEDVVIEER